MLGMKQRTIAKSFAFNGFGIHTAKFSEVSFYPLPENSGIVFRSQSVAQKYSLQSVRADARGTQVILEEGFEIMTVEHLVSALAGLGIDNVLIDVDGDEVPIKDGSAVFFAEKLHKIGFKEQAADKKIIQTPRKIKISDGRRAAVIIPADNFKLNFLLDYDDQVVRTDVGVFDFAKDDYIKELSKARTFAFDNEINDLWLNGKGLGATLENALVVSATGYSTELRYPDELVRHKMADFIGDIMVLGALPKAEFFVFRSGHAFNNKIAHELAKVALGDESDVLQ